MRISICYYYERGEKKGDRGLSDDICRHHIISFHRMYYLGVLALCYLKKRQVDEKGGVDGLGKLLQTATGNHSISIKNALDEIIYEGGGKFYLGRQTGDNKDTRIIRGQNAELYKAVKEIAWLPMNTFSGPVEKLRMDDPGQRNDHFPCGMPEQQRTALKNIIEALDHYSHSNIPHENGQGGKTQCARFENEAEFNWLVEVFFKEIKGGWQRYESKISDWWVATNNCKINGYCHNQNRMNYYCFYFGTSQHRERHLKEQMDRRNIIFGDFVLKQDKWSRESRNKKVLKILSVNKKINAKEKGNVQAELVNYDASQERLQGREIKDFFK